MKRMKIATLPLVAAAIITSCSNGGQQSAKSREAVDSLPKKVLISTVRATIESVEQQVQFTSNIEANQKNSISGIAGRITKILVKVGDRVQRGQLLVVMDQTQYTTSMVQLATLEEDYERLKSVYEAGGVSRQQFDQVESQLKVLRESVRSLKENTELRSPLTGVVTARYFDPGDLVGGQPILQVMEISALKVTTNISEFYFPVVKVGTPVHISVDLFPDQIFQGKVSLIYPVIDPASRTFTIEVAIANANNKLRPGMFSRSTIIFGRADAVVVDDVAVSKQQGTNDKYVFVIENGVARRRVVTEGRQVGKKIVILEGVNEGDEVATSGFSRLNEGTQIEVRNH